MQNKSSMRIFSIAVALLAFTSTSIAHSQESPSPAVVTLTSQTHEADLIPSATIIVDADRHKTVKEILETPPPATRAAQARTFSPGLSSAAFWFVIHINNVEDRPLERMVVFEPTWLDDVQVTLVSPAGETRSFSGGDTLDFSHRSEASRKVNFALELKPGINKLLVRIQTREPFFVGMTLLDRRAFSQSDSRESAYFGGLYGALFALLLFNFVLFLSSREKTHLFYSIHQAAFLVGHSALNGFGFPLWMPNSPELSNWAISSTTYVYSFLGLVFATVFLDLKAKQPLAFKWIRGIQILMAVSFIGTAVLDGYRANVMGATIWVVVYSVTALVLGIQSYRHRNNVAKYYLAASVAGLCGSTTTALTIMGIIPYSFMTFRAVDFGTLMDATMLSLALAAHISQAHRLERLRRFFSPAVADHLLSVNGEDLFRAHRREIVVMFLDLRGYTTFTLQHGADEVMRVLGEFHAVMGRLIAAHGATLERFAGDGMMIFFNDPIEIADPAVRACRMAMEMQEQFEVLNQTWKTRNYSLSMGVGIAQGVAVIGAIGFEGRRDYAAIGNVTNLAARLCAEAKGGQTIISSVVAENVSQVLSVHPISPLVLKGFSEPVACCEISSTAQRESKAQFRELSLAV